MATTTNKGYPLPTVGGDTDTWGTLLNQGLVLADSNLGGTASIDCSGSSDITLTSTQASNYILSLTGILTGNISVKVPQTGSFYRVVNGTTGAYTINVKTTNVSSVGVVIPQGSTWEVCSNGTNVSPCNWNDGTQFYGVDSGTASALSVATRVPIAAYFTGLLVSVQVANANDDGATLTVNSIGDKPVYDSTEGAAIVAEAWAGGQIVDFRYDAALNSGSGGWQAIGVSAAAFISNSIVVGSPTGGNQGSGSINAETIFVNGSSVSPIPAGAIVDFAGSSAPSGYLLCYGQAISRTTYATLFSVIGSIYGSGDGSTTFNVPDCRGRIGAGKDDMGGTAADRLTTAGSGTDGATLGATGGAQNITLTVDQMPSHTHTYTAPTTGGRADGFTTTQVSTTTGTSSSTGGDQAHSNVQPTIIFNKIIKT